jgi:hypothetical protein
MRDIIRSLNLFTSSFGSGIKPWSEQRGYELYWLLLAHVY